MGEEEKWRGGEERDEAGGKTWSFYIILNEKVRPRRVNGVGAGLRGEPGIGASQEGWTMDGIARGDVPGPSHPRKGVR
jgi:hypothetical protein